MITWRDLCLSLSFIQVFIKWQTVCHNEQTFKIMRMHELLILTQAAKIWLRIENTEQ